MKYRLWKNLEWIKKYKEVDKVERGKIYGGYYLELKK